MKFSIIVNPVSGKGKALSIASRLTNHLIKDGYEVQQFQTTPNSDDLTRFCLTFTPNERVVIIGGDGTLNLFLNSGCTQYESIAFYGMGTANVVSIELGIPRRLKKFVRMLETGKPKHVYLGLLDGKKKFLMMYSLGLDGLVLQRVAQSLKNRLGKLAFVPATLTSMLRYKYPRFKLRIDGDKTPTTGSFAIISRFKHYGGPFVAAGQADPEQSKLNVVLFKAGGIWKTLCFAFRLAIGKHENWKHVLSTEAQTVQLESISEPPPAQMDGDAFPHPVHSITVTKETVPLLVP